MKSVSVDDEIMLINNEGIIIRIRVSDTALQSRVTSGVKLIGLNEGEFVASVAKVRKEDGIVMEDSEEIESEQ